MFCTKCGLMLSDTDKFCTRCGAAVTPFPGNAPRESFSPAQIYRDGKTPQNPPAIQGRPEMPINEATPKMNPAFRPAILPSRRFEPNAEMKRAYNLSTLSTLVIFGAQTVIVSAGIAILAVIGVVIAIASGAIVPSDNPESIIENILSTEWLMTAIMAANAVFYAIGMLGGIGISNIIRRRLDTFPPKQRRLTAGQFIVIALMTFGVWGVGAIIGNVGNIVAPPNMPDYGWGAIPNWILAVVCAPIFEEMIFRKFILDRIAPFGERTAVIFSALIFGMAHQNGMQFFLAFFIGIIFAIVYLRTGRIRYTMILHFMINSFATLDEVGILVFGERFDTWWMIAAGILILAGIVVFFIFRRKPFFRLEPNRVIGANIAAFKPWGVKMARIIVCAFIGGYGAYYVFLASSAMDGILPLVHIVPAIAAIVTIIIVSNKTSQKVIED